MKTDDLIDALARGEDPPQRAHAMPRLALALGGGFVIGLVLLVASIGFRPNIGVVLPVVLVKTMFSAVFAITGAAAVMRLVRPGAGGRGRLLASVVLIGSAIAIGLLSLIGEAPSERFHALTYGVFPLCLVLIPLFGAPTAALLVWFARDLAPTRLAMTGAAIGAAAGGVGAMVYAMYCPLDGVAFVSVWYATAIALSSAIGAVIVARFLRW